MGTLTPAKFEKGGKDSSDYTDHGMEDRSMGRTGRGSATESFYVQKRVAHALGPQRGREGIRNIGDKAKTIPAWGDGAIHLSKLNSAPGAGTSTFKKNASAEAT